MFIMCSKCKDGIIAEVIGNSMIRIVKRKDDFHPVGVDVTGKNYDMVVSCTLCGNLEPIECVDGTVNLESLTTKEKKDKKDGEEQDPKPGTGEPGSGDPEDGKPNGDPEGGE